MTEQAQEVSGKLTRQEISDAVTGLGWRFILGVAQTSVRVGSLAQAVAVAQGAVAVAGADGDEHLRADLRPDRVVLSLQTAGAAWVTRRDVELAGQISAAVAGLGLTTGAEVGVAPDGGAPRSLQIVEIGIDALDIPLIRPFWKAVLGYGEEPGVRPDAPWVVDLAGQGPAVWFQQMDAPRPQRNRIHFDISVPHDEAARRIAAALAAGGTLLSDEEAPAFWVLADAEGNEACITTWQGRDG